MATKPATKAITFTWEGVNKRGEKTRGEMVASTVAFVKASLRQQGIIPNKVRRKPKPLFSKRPKKITQGDITVFSRQMATMLAAGIPLVQAFDIVGKGQENVSLKKLINSVKVDVESGTTFSEALAKQPKFFNELFCNLVDAGEQSGSLDVMLDKVATYKEKTESIKRKIKKALTYPSAVLAVAFLVTAGLLLFVVPQFETLFEGFGAGLPAVTQMVVNLSKFFQAYWWIIFGALGGAIWTFIYFFHHSKTFVHFIDRLLLRIPIIGPIIKKAAIARFSRTLAITFAAGLPLVEALKSVAGATGNTVFYNASMQIREDVSTGQQLQQSMRHANLFPNMAIQMVAIGEESGALETMLSKVADFFEEEVDAAVDNLSSLIEPFIMVILGVLVGGLVVAMYMPIFKLGSVI
jgi:type IV pilus assembly protein PilC